MRLGLRMGLNSRGAGGGGDIPSLDLQFAADKTLTARKGPTPTFTRASTARFVGSDGLIQSAAINTPRFDHDPVTFASKGLLIEESRTNQITYSENLADPSWSTFSTASGANVTSTNPSGATTTTRITANAGTDTGRVRLKLLTIPSASYAVTASCFVKAGNSNFGLVSMAFNKSGVGAIRNCLAHIVFSTGVITKSGTSNADFTVTSTAFTDGWYRITISATSNASLTVEDQVVLSTGLSFNGVGGSGTFAGTETVFAWGAQLEAGSFPTSYIPTTTASVVRSGDVCSITGSDFTGMYNQSEGTFFTQSTKISTNANAFIFHVSDNSFLNGLDLRYNSATNPAALMNVSNVNQLTGFNATITSGSSPKQAVAYKLNDCAYSANGASVIIDTSALIPTVSRLNIGGAFNNTLAINGHIASVRYFKKRLSNSKIQAITV